MQLTPEQEQIGRDNFHEAVGLTRRDFMTAAAAAGGGLGALYFGYEALAGSPVKVGFIGTGDEGNILLSEHPPEYMDVVAIADIRPANRERAFTGDGNEHRVGLVNKLGSGVRKSVRVYENHKQLLEDPEVEAVVIATPLVSHHRIVMDALDAGKHVLCEKLMAKTVAECKEMIRRARETGLLLAVGHQRHYSVLYENANQIVEQGLLGDIKFIRAQWHRNNSFPGRDSWVKYPPKPKREWGVTSNEEIAGIKDQLELVQKLGFESVEQFVDWRLFANTGGGLMAELGSHQMDAASIFLGKVHPVAVSGYGAKNFYGVKGVGSEDKQKDKREIDDHIYVTYEFPGPHHAEDEDDICIVTYSSISTNRFEPYGETVYGSRATLAMKTEKEALLWKESSPWSPGGPDQRLYVVDNASGGGPALDAYETSAPSTAAARAQTGIGDKISRGYREEMEHFAFIIRNFQNYYPGGTEISRAEGGLRCNGVIAMADAVMALTANLAMKHKTRIEFRDEWFDPLSDATPEEDVAKMTGTV